MRIHFMTIRQKEETFLLTKFKASELLEHVTFHFRQAYINDKAQDISMKKYLEELNKKGLSVDSSTTGIQRRLLLSKINRITHYLLEDEESFFPNAVILSTDLSKDESDIDALISNNSNEFGELSLPDNVKFTIVDGQHRLAGLFLAGNKIQNDFEIPAILLINITINTCAKIFSDVNGTQSTVNKSVLLDLYEMTPDSELEDDKERYEKKCYHVICRNFNTDPTSPLYRHIKMLGIGDGAISQAFFVNALAKAIPTTGLSYNDIQNTYDNLFGYFRAFQRVFFDQWPVLESPSTYEEFRRHSLNVMKERKSQILKTNGFGGIMKAFPTIYDYLKRNGELSYNAYHNIIERLKGEIDWCKDFTEGTGAKNQDKVKERILSILGLKDINKKDASKIGV